ncbi:Uncharacterized protein HZ326_3736 [Fusarium oxysporum f. sp. albedinis]|nr:Uncharacterized protein HZ326_3736 [Fusarium oxysporum f. sp. albedinis]
MIRMQKTRRVLEGSAYDIFLWGQLGTFGSRRYAETLNSGINSMESPWMVPWSSRRIIVRRRSHNAAEASRCHPIRMTTRLFELTT